LPFNEVVTSESLKFFESESKKEEERKIEKAREKAREKEKEREIEKEREREREKGAEKERENHFILSPIRSIQRYLIVLVLITAISGGFSFTFLKPKTKWEYKIAAPSDSAFEGNMNRLGAEGWEIVSARRATTKNYITGETEGIYECILKRPK